MINEWSYALKVCEFMFIWFWVSMLVCNISTNNKKSKILKLFKKIFSRKDRVTRLAEEVIDNEWALKNVLYDKLHYNSKEYSPSSSAFDDYNIDGVIQNFGNLINKVEKSWKFTPIKFGKGEAGIYKLNEYLEKYELPFRFTYISEPKYGNYFTTYFIERINSNIVKSDDVKSWFKVNLINFLTYYLSHKDYMDRDEFFVFASILEDLKSKAFYGTNKKFDINYEPSVSNINFDFRHNGLNFIIKIRRNKKYEPQWFLEEYDWSGTNEKLS